MEREIGLSIEFVRDKILHRVEITPFFFHCVDNKLDLLFEFHLVHDFVNHAHNFLSGICLYSKDDHTRFSVFSVESEGHAP